MVLWHIRTYIVRNARFVTPIRDGSHWITRRTCSKLIPEVCYG